MQRNDMEQERGEQPFVPFLARTHERPRPQPVPLPRPAARARVGLVDSSRLTRECLAGALGAAGGDFAVQGFTTAAECIGAAAAGFDLLLCHAHGEGRAAMPVLDDIGALHSACPDTPIVVLHDSAEPTDPAFVRRLFVEGAQGFVPTSRIGLPLAAPARLGASSDQIDSPDRMMLCHIDNKSIFIRSGESIWSERALGFVGIHRELMTAAAR
ncbi:hypothetical protein [Acidiphilium sp. C61]|uniref:hypothetical protein n=1 Tax=Acidiphilium sp. C61 TaxID=1671485 RepID=UPI00157AA4F9|nr:hypothetical protein [Acidiphilium sp. C61]